MTVETFALILFWLNLGLLVGATMGYWLGASEAERKQKSLNRTLNNL